MADSIQDSMGIPVVVVSFDIESIGESYSFLGDILGCADRADELGAYCDKLIGDVKEKSAKIADGDKVKFYYTAGGNGLQTSPEGSSHTEVIELVGGINVVDLAAESNGRLKVNMEQVLAWNPDVVVTSSQDDGSNPTYDQIMGNSNTWGMLDAVKNGKVISAPSVPFSGLTLRFRKPTDRYPLDRKQPLP
jgi:iron complex transport system substrate-binding protein